MELNSDLDRDSGALDATPKRQNNEIYKIIENSMRSSVLEVSRIHLLTVLVVFQVGMDDSGASEDVPPVGGLLMGETLGQGAFGCVKSASLEVDKNIVVAVKFIHMPTCNENGLQERDIMREVVLHNKCSQHPNVLRLIDCNTVDDYIYIILEMADGGDLFDKIEPDLGVDLLITQFYFQQLVNVITYLHEQCGVAHRDIKPENILLDKSGNLKLADFGLASQFKRKDGTWKRSMDQRGSPPYLAPEILYSKKPYYANVTDIWSIGIFTFVLITGAIPWELPAWEDVNYSSFLENDGNVDMGPWKRVDIQQLSLLRKILQQDPSERITLSKLRSHPWFTQKNKLMNSKGLCNDPAALANRLLSRLNVSLDNGNYNTSLTQTLDSATRSVSPPLPTVSTQPVYNDVAYIQTDSLPNDQRYPNTQRPSSQYYALHDELNYYSTQVDDTLLKYMENDYSTLQFQSQQNIRDKSLNALQFRPFKLTKFYSLEPMENLLPILEKALQLSGIKVTPDLYRFYQELLEKKNEDVFPLKINMKNFDSRGGKLVGFISIRRVKADLKSLEFVRKSGDPLEWRRLFKKIALFSRDIILIVK
ncbi:serine/threonine protein kinase CHK1 KNAG_0C01820 [Huiozyma naganishii CBS 8797]|uniref:Protein kinase domain-containing protein n=1 Tax=Huiozyma naganishii (strain ATCC MYA-139 / BCRC 22969 / CBS 8797 / KCTC 17520 / NBRC 10181 / NCYC 3082 / Yp74L-3) TaxID=1071383 RepID=J7S5Q1_HUIN7|nr:hypothetical protein KNAG_0C01820 [Kazachstania naganishii CBS 8797]CCK69296.1 hypothetical protein KNAG_0C01820 [Kazachstania naganishii CBS 8797]